MSVSDKFETQKTTFLYVQLLTAAYNFNIFVKEVEDVSEQFSENVESARKPRQSAGRSAHRYSDEDDEDEDANSDDEDSEDDDEESEDDDDDDEDDESEERSFDDDYDEEEEEDVSEDDDESELPSEISSRRHQKHRYSQKPPPVKIPLKPALKQPSKKALHVER